MIYMRQDHFAGIGIYGCLSANEKALKTMGNQITNNKYHNQAQWRNINPWIYIAIPYAKCCAKGKGK